MTAGRVRWGVLSTARIGRKVIPGIAAAPNCEVVAIASRDAAAARSTAEAHGIGRAHASYEALLADPDVDAVYIPLPNHLHAEWTIRAAEAGKHVLCEKPLATSVVEAERMIEACDRAGVRLMEAFMYRHHPSWVALRDLVRSGRIGRLLAVQIWFSFFNDDPSNIRNRVDAGGGALFDIGCYAINVARMLFAQEPIDVAASVRRDGTGTDVLTSALLTFPDGDATFTVSTRAEDDQRVHVHGTTGRIAIEIPFNIPPDRPTRVHVFAGGDPPVSPGVETLTFAPMDPYAAEAAAFAAAVLEDGPLPVSTEDAIANLRVIERVFAAGAAHPSPFEAARDRVPPA